MSYQVLARKWRPRTFDEVVGQPTLTRTLRNALASGRVGHAFLLSGARGVGKTTTARILAKALNCSCGPAPTPDPCGACPSCLEIASGTALDVQEIDGATNNGVEQVRELRESARYNPARDRFKIWIIDEVHMLSTGAFNALLKTLEEPPPRVKFIFATTEYHKIPDTILSRCQQYDFRMIPARELLAHLRAVADGEKIAVTEEALARIARAAEGSVRDALSLFDQVLAFSGDEVKDEDVTALLGLIDREVLLRASSAVLGGDSLAVLELVEGLADYGADYRNFARELLLHFRELLLLKVAPEGSRLLAGVLPEERQRLKPLADAFSEEDLLRIFDVLTEAESDLRMAQDPRVTLELALLKLVQMRRLMPFVELVERVERLAGGLPAAPSSAAAPAPPRPVPPRPRPLELLAGSAPPAPAAAPSPAVVAPPVEAAAPASPAAPAGDANAILAEMISLCVTRPSVVQPLRAASARLEGDTLVLEVVQDFMAFANMYVDEYREFAKRAAGRTLKIQVGAGTSAAAALADAAAPPSQEQVKRERLRKEAEREPAVQDALDLFDGKVVDVREAKPAKESA
jgi:DNA polymerase III subunit gamma/tau